MPALSSRQTPTRRVWRVVLSYVSETIDDDATRTIDHVRPVREDRVVYRRLCVHRDDVDATVSICRVPAGAPPPPLRHV